MDKEGSKKPLFARSPYLEAEVIISDTNKRKLLGEEAEVPLETENYLSLEYAEKVGSCPVQCPKNAVLFPVELSFIDV